MRTSFHHQPEAQHPNFSAIHKLAGRLPHLSGANQKSFARYEPYCFEPKRSLYSTSLSALVTDRAMEAWYHASIA